MASTPLVKIREHAPDLVISDVHMPRMNGFNWLPQRSRNPDLRPRHS